MDFTYISKIENDKELRSPAESTIRKLAMFLETDAEKLILLAKKVPQNSGDFPTTGKYNFPQLARTNYLPEEPVLPFNYLKSTKDRENYWFHCFTSEKYFHKLYNRFEDYVELLRQAKGVISADCSLYRDYPEEILIANCRANRLVDYALQQAGIPIIPTAGFADESSWEWCFDGLPLNSTVAITTNCLGRDKEAYRLHASKKISDELARRSKDEQLPGKIILISLHETFEAGFNAVYAGYQEAKRKEQVNFKVEFWFNGEITVLKEEE